MDSATWPHGAAIALPLLDTLLSTCNCPSLKQDQGVLRLSGQQGLAPLRAAPCSRSSPPPSVTKWSTLGRALYKGNLGEESIRKEGKSEGERGLSSLYEVLFKSPHCQGRQPPQGSLPSLCCELIVCSKCFYFSFSGFSFPMSICNILSFCQLRPITVRFVFRTHGFCCHCLESATLVFDSCQ